MFRKSSIYKNTKIIQTSYFRNFFLTCCYWQLANILNRLNVKNNTCQQNTTQKQERIQRDSLCSYITTMEFKLVKHTPSKGQSKLSTYCFFMSRSVLEKSHVTFHLNRLKEGLKEVLSCIYWISQ